MTALVMLAAPPMHRLRHLRTGLRRPIARSDNGLLMQNLKGH